MTSRMRRVLAVGALLGLVAACGGGDEGADDDEPAFQREESTFERDEPAVSLGATTTATPAQTGTLELFSGIATTVLYSPSSDFTPVNGVTADATSGADVRCVEAVDMFFAFLGSCAGNLALTLGARGGIYIGGGIPPRLGDWIDRSAFRERFVAKGRFRDYLDAIPTWLIVADTSPALIGAARALDEL